MPLNDGAEIVPCDVFRALLRRDPRASTGIAPDNYARFQLLTEENYHRIVFENYDHSFFSYGEDSEDFPLCADFCDILTGRVKEAAIKARLAVRIGMVDLYYTKPSGKRHAIKAFVCAFGGPTIYFDPQADWLKEPADCATMDEFRA